VIPTLGDDHGIGDLVLPGAWVPVLYPLIGAVIAFAVSCTLERERRRVALGVLGVCVGVSVTVFLVRIAVPWLAVLLEDQFTRDWRSVAPPVVTWAGGIALALLRPRLPRMAVRLGGLVSTAAMVYAFVLIVHWVLVSRESPLDWMTWRGWWHVTWLGAGILLLVIDITGVQWWSLHPLYRARLASTFALDRAESGEIRSQPTGDWKRWSDVSEAVRPKHVVCAQPIAVRRRSPGCVPCRTGSRVTASTCSSRASTDRDR